MTWLFSRGKEKIRLETWYDKHTSEFVVDIEHPDRQRASKRFVNDRVFRTWLAARDTQLAAQGWKQSGPFLSEPDRLQTESVGSPVAGDTNAADSATKNRTYSTGTHRFEVTLSRILIREQPLWTVALVTETSHGKRLLIPGLHAVVSPTADATFSRACDHIDKWLLAKSRG